MKAKRLMDIWISGLLLPLLLFLVPVMWIAGRAGGCPRVFFRQARIGCGGSEMYLLKFRTLGGTRGTPLARGFLKIARKIGLDELPQIFLVLRGQMSLVGPRPLVRRELYVTTARGHPRLREAIRLRQSVKPGITGLSQVSLRTRRRWGSSYWDMLAMDLWYVEHRSAWVDLLLLAFTPLYSISFGRLLFPGRFVLGDFRSSATVGESSAAPRVVG